MVQSFGVKKWTAVLESPLVVPEGMVQTVEANNKDQLLEKIKEHRNAPYEHLREMANIAERAIELLSKPPREVKITPDGFEFIGIGSISKKTANKLGRWWIIYCKNGELAVKVIV